MNIFFGKGRFGFSVLFTLCLVGCRGQTSSQPPILPIRNMVTQTTYPPQSQNGITANVPPPDTVAQDAGHYDSVSLRGQDEKGAWVKHIPVQVTLPMLERGQERFNIYCSPCHGYAGHADGLVSQHAGGTIQAPNLHDAQKLTMDVGQIYSAVTNGVNNWHMPGFSEQMSESDRWAVVAYVRALQLAEHAKEEDVPEQIKTQNHLVVP